MSIGFIFWLMMLLWILFGAWGLYPYTADKRYMIGGSLFSFVLFFLLGWKVFGFIIQG